MENIAVKIGLEPQSTVVGQRLALPARMDMARHKLRKACSPGAAENLCGMIGTLPIPN
jgi:hypothetical protein